MTRWLTLMGRESTPADPAEEESFTTVRYSKSIAPGYVTLYGYASATAIEEDLPAVKLELPRAMCSREVFSWVAAIARGDEVPFILAPPPVRSAKTPRRPRTK